ncbi:MAG: SO_0444 family Cu/Zn efflux transporter [Candidatus Omnitrophota bacterium]
MATNLFGIFTGILKESYLLLNKMAPYLMFGFFFAGILHIFIDTRTVSRHLGKNSFFSVVKASLFGMPLPLCSCSVIPAAMSLRREGASRGAVLSFLISAPTTGVDSILATYSLLGWIFTVYRIAASFLTGVIAGIAANFIIGDGENRPVPVMPACRLCHEEKEHGHGILKKTGGVFSYAFSDILKDSGPSLLVGILIGGVITYVLPVDFFQTYIGSGIRSMFLMLLVGIPMYVCATASIPIAAALMLKGLGPGAAFVFLVAGPATNIVTMTVVFRDMGWKALVIYLGSIVFSSIGLGFMLDKVYFYMGQTAPARIMLHHYALMPAWAGESAGAVLLAIILYQFLRTRIVSAK